VSLLQDLSGDKAAIGRATFADIQSRMVGPMQRAFRAGDRIAGVATFMAYVFNDPQAWTKMSLAAQQETLRDVHEWDVMMKGWHSFFRSSPQLPYETSKRRFYSCRAQNRIPSFD
jgi:hypothetical protein